MSKKVTVVLTDSICKELDVLAEYTGQQSRAKTLRFCLEKALYEYSGQSSFRHLLDMRRKESKVDKHDSKI